ncbi:MAG: hypothetical protein AAF585_11960, partial [Verrucomicrobiota bacterium]
MIRFPDVWDYVEANFACGSYSPHGIDHWRRVHRNARILATRTAADEPVIELFAAYHDSCRINDASDPGHGKRGGFLAESQRGELYELSDEQFRQLQYACDWHTDEHHHDDPTIYTCWDADRLDLGRVGIVTSPGYLNSEFAKEICAQPGLDFVLSELAE